MSKKDKNLNQKNEVKINDNFLDDVSGGTGFSSSYSQGKISVSLPRYLVEERKLSENAKKS